MRLSQLTRRINRDDMIMVFEQNAPVDQNLLYEGRVRGIKRDNPINRMSVSHVCAVGDTIVVEVVKWRI